MEIWKDIIGYEHLYQVSNHGNVKALKRTIINKNGKPQAYPERMLKLDKLKRQHGLAYLRVTLCKEHTTKKYQVHRLVATHFVDNVSSKDTVNHIDNNPSNNHYSNLEWCTHSENMLHAQKQGRLFISQSNAGKVGGAINRAKSFKRIQPLLGTYVNDWYVIPDTFTEKNGHRYILCRCKCGTEKCQDVRRVYNFQITMCSTCSRVS